MDLGIWLSQWSFDQRFWKGADVLMPLRCQLEIFGAPVFGHAGRVDVPRTAQCHEVFVQCGWWSNGLIRKQISNSERAALKLVEGNLVQNQTGQMANLRKSVRRRNCLHQVHKIDIGVHKCSLTYWTLRPTIFGYESWCGWRGSNPRPLASEANTLSTELQPRVIHYS